MPPPPPSKSYLLKFDDLTDSEDEEDDYFTAQGETSNRSVTPTPVRAPDDLDGDDDYPTASAYPVISEVSMRIPQVATAVIPQATVIGHDEDQHLDSSEEQTDDDDGEEKKEDPVATAGSKKKRKKKKKKKKKKKNGNKTAAEDTISPGRSGLHKSVSFGHVVVTEFERCLGTDGIPGDGGWPLGISTPVEVIPPPEDIKARIRPELRRTLSTDSSVDEYEEQKQAKLIERWNALKKAAADNQDDVLATTELKMPLETRQWDYKDKCRNPLFRRLTEQERMHILIAHSTENPEEEHNSSPKSTKRKEPEIYNDTYTQVEVHSVRNELERIRNSRSMEGHTGCTCRKLQVYLLPPGGGGKKAHHRRMKPQQVKQELRKRRLLPTETKTREELELLLHDAVEKEPCCINEDCFCVRNGIECQADTCACWLSSHQTAQSQKKHKDTEALSVQEIQNRCGNPNGMYTVDLTAIDEFRRQFLSGKYCQETNSAATGRKPTEVTVTN